MTVTQKTKRCHQARLQQQQHQRQQPQQHLYPLFKIAHQATISTCCLQFHKALAGLGQGGQSRTHREGQPGAQLQAGPFRTIQVGQKTGTLARITAYLCLLVRQRCWVLAVHRWSGVGLDSGDNLFSATSQAVGIQLSCVLFVGMMRCVCVSTYLHEKTDRLL